LKEVLQEVGNWTPYHKNAALIYFWSSC